MNIPLYYELVKQNKRIFIQTVNMHKKSRPAGRESNTFNTVSGVKSGIFVFLTWFVCDDKIQRCTQEKKTKNAVGILDRIFQYNFH